MATSEDKELKQRLGLYQVFLKLYEHHRGLLDEILKVREFGFAVSKGDRTSVRARHGARQSWLYNYKY